MRTVIAAISAALMIVDAGAAYAQSAHPEPGVAFGDDYAPKPAFPEQTKAHGPAVHSNVKVEVVASGLQHPWALASLPDGRFLVTERPGRLRIVSADGTLSEPLD